MSDAPQVPPPKPDALALTSFCGLPADAMEKHLKVCPPDCDPAVWQPDATQPTGEAQQRGRTDGERLDWSIDYPDEFASTTNAIKWTGDSTKNKSLWRAAIDAAMSRTEGRAT